MIDKKKFIEDIKKDLNIEKYEKKQKFDTFNDFENLNEIFSEALKKESTKDIMNNTNNIYKTCKITKDEAINGCIKKTKFKCITPYNKEKKKTEVKIPKSIEDGQKIILQGEGNLLKPNDKRGNLIIDIKIK